MDPWVLVIVLFLVFAVIFFILKLMVDYPGLSHIQCIYSEETVREETLFENYQLEKLRKSVQKSTKRKKFIPSSSSNSSSYRLFYNYF